MRVPKRVSAAFLGWAISAANVKDALRVPDASDLAAELTFEYKTLLGYSTEQAAARLARLEAGASNDGFLYARSDGVRLHTSRELEYAYTFRGLQVLRSTVRAACTACNDGPYKPAVDAAPAPASNDLGDVEYDDDGGDNDEDEDDMVSLADVAAALGVDVALLAEHIPRVVSAVADAAQIGTQLRQGYALLGLNKAAISRQLRALQLVGIKSGKASKAAKPREREYAALFEPLRAFRAALADGIPDAGDGGAAESDGDDGLGADSGGHGGGAAPGVPITYEISVDGVPMAMADTTTVLAIKQVVAHRTGVPIASQLLSTEESVVDVGVNSSTLADIGVSPGTDLRVRRLRRDTHILVFATASPHFRLAAEVLPDATIADLQEALLRQEGVPLRRQTLYLDGHLLAPSDKLSDHSIEDMHELELRMDWSMAATTVRLYVKTLTGKTVVVTAEPSDTARVLRYLIQNLEGIPPVQQRLIYGGTQLALTCVLADSGIGDGATLHLVLRLRGD